MGFPFPQQYGTAYDHPAFGRNFSILFWPCFNDFVHVTQAVLASGANPNLKTSKGFTPRHAACIAGRVQSVSLILNSPHYVPEQQYTTNMISPVLLAGFYKHNNLVWELLNAKVDVSHAEC